MQEKPVEWRRFVVLRHTTGPDSSHYDWLFDEGDGAGDADDRRLRAFRCGVLPRDIDEDEGSLIEPLPPHRLLYLSVDSPMTLSGERGVVETVCRGAWRCGSAPRTANGERLEILLEGADQPICFLIVGGRIARID